MVESYENNQFGKSSWTPQQSSCCTTVHCPHNLLLFHDRVAANVLSAWILGTA